MLGGLHFRQRARSELDRQLRNDAYANGFLEGRQHVREVGRMDVARAREEGVEILLLGQLLQLVEPEVWCLGDGHGDPPPSATVRTGPGRTATRSTRVALAARMSNSRPWYVKRSPARGIRPSA